MSEVRGSGRWVAALILFLAVAGLFLVFRPGPPPPQKETLEEIYMPGFPLYRQDARRLSVQLFFPTRDLLLQPEDREIYESGEAENRLRQAAVLLLKGPETPGLLPLFPPGTRLRELYLYEGSACVDLKMSDEMRPNRGVFMEYLAVAGLRASLTQNFPEVESVRILVNGREAETLFGHIRIRGPLPPPPAGGESASPHRNF